MTMQTKAPKLYAAMVAVLLLGNVSVLLQHLPAAWAQYTTPANTAITYANTADGTCAAASAELVAASTTLSREVTISVPSSATTGIRIAFDAAAGSTSFLLGAGQAVTVSGKQQIRCIRAGGSDVTVSILIGK